MNVEDAEDKAYIKAMGRKAAQMWVALDIPTRDEIAATLSGGNRQEVANLLTKMLALDTTVSALAAELCETNIVTLQAVKLAAVLRPGDVIQTPDGVVVVFDDGLALPGPSEEGIRRRAASARDEVKVKLRDRAQRN